jgi:hypothetical protein
MHHIIDSNEKEQTHIASSFYARRPVPILNVAAQGYPNAPSPRFPNISPLLSPASTSRHSPTVQTPTVTLHDLLKSFDFDGLRRSNPFIYKLIQKQQKKLKEQKKIIEELRSQLHSQNNKIENDTSKSNISAALEPEIMAGKRKMRPVVIKESFDDIQLDSDANEDDVTPRKRIKP